MSPANESKAQGAFITQEDIDEAFRAARQAEIPSAQNDTDTFFLEETDIIATEVFGDADLNDFEDLGVLSKEDIEALLHGDLVEPTGKNVQDEIDSLLQTGGTEKNKPALAVGGRSGSGNPAQDDVERLMSNSTGDSIAKVEGGAMETPATVPDASEKAGAVSQDDIDQLLMAAVDTAEDDGKIDPETAPVVPQEEGMVSQNDIDRLLMGAMDEIGDDVGEDSEVVPVIDVETAAAPREDTGSLISPSDLDQLMGTVPLEQNAAVTPSREAGASSEHISQDDINRLLKESLEAAEEQPDEAKPDNVDEIEVPEPVILAAEDDKSEPAPPVSEKPSVKFPRIKVPDGLKKIRGIAAVAAGIVLIVTLSFVMKFSRPTETATKPRVLTFAVPRMDANAPVASAVSGKNVLLTGFIILAPPNSEAVTYLAADLRLDLSDASIVGVIKENESFVRDIIYGAINNEMMTRDISAIDEAGLELVIRKALGRIIPREAIERIDFEKFSLA